jgi:hypothetical protein
MLAMNHQFMLMIHFYLYRHLESGERAESLLQYGFSALESVE